MTRSVPARLRPWRPAARPWTVGAGHWTVDARPWTVDAGLVAVLIVGALAGHGFGAGDHPSTTGRFLALGLAVPQTVPLLARRTRPGTVLVLVTAAMVAHLLAGLPALLGGVSVAVAAYSTGRYATHRTRILTRIAIGLATLATLLSFLRSTHSFGLLTLLLACALFLLALLAGEQLRTQRALLASLRERAAQLERDRDEQTRYAVTDERARIARELHDVVAHHVSAVAVQAQAAQYTRDPEQITQALRHIQATSDQILTELRQLLGLLRDEPTALAPQPGLAELDDLLDATRDAGLIVTVRTSGDVVTLPEGLDLSAYRILQEALTNVRRHSQARVVGVSINCGLHQVELQVRDDGRGPPSDARPGRGLIGIRERVALYGGSCQIGPAPGGGFQVQATLPLRQDTPCQSGS